VGLLLLDAQHKNAERRIFGIVLSCNHFHVAAFKYIYALTDSSICVPSSPLIMRFGSLVRSRSILIARREMKAQASRQFLVGGNWKCNGTVESVKTLVSDLNAGTFPSDVEVVCAPTFVHLPMVQASLDDRFQISAQNCWTAPGAYTGEISADMLANMGIPWVITGHSERRALCGESSTDVGKKTAYALGKGLKVIACVGETLPQRETGKLWDVLSEQMSALKDSISLSDWAKVVIAYEPVWAIGTGVVATPDQAQVRIASLTVLNCYLLHPGPVF
jgi:triosephosphate isomerase (TIM)